MPKQRPTNLKWAFAQSPSILTVWKGLMILRGKATEPVLGASVLAASGKVLPRVHVSPLSWGQKTRQQVVVARSNGDREEQGCAEMRIVLICGMIPGNLPRREGKLFSFVYSTQI